MLQRIPIALEIINPGNTSEKLLNKIQQIMYIFLSSKQNY